MGRLEAHGPVFNRTIGGISDRERSTHPAPVESSARLEMKAARGIAMAMTDGVIGGVMAGILSVTVLLIPMPGMVTRLTTGELGTGGINGIPRLNLKTIRTGTGGCCRSEQNGAVNQRDIVLIESQNRLQIVFADLIKVKLDIISSQPC